MRHNYVKSRDAREFLSRANWRLAQLSPKVTPNFLMELYRMAVLQFLSFPF
jgi:hypothetical protein